MTSLFSEAQSSAAIKRLSFLSVADSYLRYYAAGRTHTARAKRLDVRHFVEFLKVFRGKKTSNALTVADWDNSSVQAFIENRLERGEKPATVARRLATLKHMGRTLAEKVAGFINPAREVKSPRLQIQKPKALSKSEIREILEQAKKRRKDKPSFSRLRNETLLALLLDTGIRADEIRLLRRRQLDDDLSWIKEVRTKGKRFRNVYITTSIRAHLKEYLVARGNELKRFFPRLSAAIDGNLPLFPSSYGASANDTETFFMAPKTVWRAVREVSVQTKLHPHLLRHSYALDLLESSRDVRLVSQALGHSDVRTTMRYTERKDEEIAAALERSRKENQRTRG